MLMIDHAPLWWLARHRDMNSKKTPLVSIVAGFHIRGGVLAGRVPRQYEMW